MRTDYHVHTSMTDSSDPLLKVAQRAKALGLERIVIADHCCFPDPKELKKAEEETGIEIIGNSVEVWTSFEGMEIHLVGDDVNPNNNLNKVLQHSLDLANNETYAVLEQCASNGLGKYDLKKEFPGKKYLSRKDVAVLISRKKKIPFKDALAMIDVNKYSPDPSKRIITVERATDFLIPLEEAVNLIKQARGRVRIPHPGEVLYDSAPKKADARRCKVLLKVFEAADPYAVELVSCWHNGRFNYDIERELRSMGGPYMIRLLDHIMNRKQLTGSDDHGDYKKPRFRMETLTQLNN